MDEMNWSTISISEEDARFPVENTQMRMPGTLNIKPSTNMATDHVFPHPAAEKRRTRECGEFTESSRVLNNRV
jgi:hypothetical protein